MVQIYGMDIKDLPDSEPKPDIVCLCVVDRFGEIVEVLADYGDAGKWKDPKGMTIYPSFELLKPPE